jgi:hypothetical protein
MHTSVRRSFAAFWSASLLGFAGWGWLAARLCAAALGEGPAGEELETAVALGLGAAVLLGAPAALLYALVMRRVEPATAWPAALAAGAALSAAIAVPLRALATALPGDGVAGGIGPFAAAAATAMMAGAIAGVATPPALLPRASLAARRDAGARRR